MAEDDQRKEVRLLNAQVANRARCTTKCPYYLDCPLAGILPPNEDGDRPCALSESPHDERIRYLNLSRSDESGLDAEISKAIWHFGQRVKEKPSLSNLSLYIELLLKYRRLKCPPSTKAANPVPESSQALTVTVTEAPAPKRIVNVPGIGDVEVLEESDDPESLFYSSDEKLTGVDTNGE